MHHTKEAKRPSPEGLRRAQKRGNAHKQSMSYLCNVPCTNITNKKQGKNKGCKKTGWHTHAKERQKIKRRWQTNRRAKTG